MKEVNFILLFFEDLFIEDGKQTDEVFSLIYDIYFVQKHSWSSGHVDMTAWI